MSATTNRPLLVSISEATNRQKQPLFRSAPVPYDGVEHAPAQEWSTPLKRFCGFLVFCFVISSVCRIFATFLVVQHDKMKVVIVKYNAGNIGSVENAVKRLGIIPVVTDDVETICGADRVIFPGQGEARSTMAYLQTHGLDKVIVGLKQPVLGICIGMQLMCRHSEEQDTDCLGVFDVNVKRFVPRRHENKVPQMGWNTIENTKTPLFSGFAEKEFVYFIHSFYVPTCNWTIATTNYIHPYSSALHKDNFYATQFHPEKSGRVGEKILKNFMEL